MRLKIDIQKAWFVFFKIMIIWQGQIETTLYLLPYTETKPFHNFISIS